MTRSDGRGSYPKAKHIHYLLTQLYTFDQDIPHEDIEYLITHTYKYYDKRTFEKYFTILEKDRLLVKAPHAYRYSIRKTVTKQKSNGISQQFFRGNGYCWSHYRLGRIPLTTPSPRYPPQSSLNEKGWERRKEETEKICVCEEKEEPLVNVPNVTGYDVVTALPEPERRDRASREEKRESSIPHTHIILPGEYERNTIHEYLQQLRDGTQTR